MNILILNWRDPKNPHAGGAEIVTREHAKAWVEAGHNVTWFASSFPSAKKSEKIDGILIIRKGNWLSVFFYAPFFYLFSKNSFDIVVDEIHGIPFFTPMYVRKPKVGFIHEVATDIWDSMFPFPINVLGKALERISLSFYKSLPFITVSQSTKSELRSIGIKNVTTIINGNSLPVLKTPVNKKNNLTFIFVSRIVKMKGVEEVLKAFENIHIAFPDARLWIVGDGEKGYLEELKNAVEKSGMQDAITFWGKVSEDKKKELLKLSFVLLHASIKEGWGLVVVEAASQSTPSIVYNVGGLRDSVRDGITGVVVRKNTPQILANEAISLIQDKERYQRYQQECLEWAGQLHWKEATKASLDFIQKTRTDYDSK